MSTKRLRARVPSARVVSLATLNEHDLRFHKRSEDGSGKCDIYETSNSEHSVIGVVFDICESEKLELDRKEGLGLGYDQKWVNLVSPSGSRIHAITYFAIDIVPNLTPYHWYKHHVLMGARENGLPKEYINKINAIESMSDHNVEREIHEMAIYDGS